MKNFFDSSPLDIDLKCILNKILTVEEFNKIASKILKYTINEIENVDIKTYYVNEKYKQNLEIAILYYNAYKKDDDDDKSQRYYVTCNDLLTDLYELELIDKLYNFIMLRKNTDRYIYKLDTFYKLVQYDFTRDIDKPLYIPVSANINGHFEIVGYNKSTMRYYRGE